MRLLKYIAYILMVCAALVIGGVIFLVNYVNPNDYKAQISEQVAQRTGKTLVINGNISWSFFPWLGIVVQDVELTSLAKIQEAAIEVKVLPLFYKKIEVGALKIKGLDLNLVKNAQGVTNW
ncbi:MAG: AsmA family protein, partial [Gammaproteobacteria bacterium]